MRMHVVLLIFMWIPFNHMDPNPAVSARAVFPDSDHIRRFPKEIHICFSKLEPTKVRTAYGVQYIKLMLVIFHVFRTEGIIS